MILSRLAALLCIAAVAAACTTPANRTAPVDHEATAVNADGDSASATVAAADKDPFVCKTVVPTGTRVAQRTCMRQSEFDKARRDGGEMLGEVQRRGVQTGNVVKE